MSDVDFRLAHQLNAVLGWLELGNIKEARAELEALPSEYAEDGDVLEMRWVLHARTEDWETAFQVAESLRRVRPESASSWLHYAYALRRSKNGGLQSASDALRPAADKFPSEPTIPFNLACYACQMDRLDEARTWLKEAVRRQDNGDVKALALADEDLKQLWPEIRRW